MNTFEASFDRFGILQKFPTLSGGRVWTAQWDNHHARPVTSGRRDPDDPEFEARGTGTRVEIDGAGVARVSGDSPRMYVYVPGQTWKNVEVTFYGQRIDETGAATAQGWVCGVRSEHQDNKVDPSLARSYYGRMLYSGRIHFTKEFWHKSPENIKIYGSNRPSEHQQYPWPTSDGSMPCHQWIGYKLVVRNSADNQQVQFAMYLDLTDGHAGGDWTKLIDWKDEHDDDWPPKSPLPADYPADRVWRNAASSVFVRNDKLIAAEYKKFSIREIEPLA